MWYTSVVPTTQEVKAGGITWAQEFKASLGILTQRKQTLNHTLLARRKKKEYTTDESINL
jgi:hypothetical protein